MAAGSFAFEGVCVRAIVTCLFISLSIAQGAAQEQGGLDPCDGAGSPDLQIAHCTATIDAKAFAGNDLAFAFNNRGLAYYAKRDFERAISDFSEATKLDPKFAHGYANRALVHRARQEPERAIADYDQAIRLDPAYAYAFRG